MRQLAEQGESVISVSTSGALDDLARRFLGETAQRIVCVKADVLDLEKVKAVLHEFAVETVIHGAAITAIGDLEREVPYQAVMVNVGGTATMLEASRLQGIQRFFYLSSATIYGSGDPEIPLREDARPNPSGIYSITKQAAEQIVCRYFDIFKIKGAILRISTPYGPMEKPSERRELMSPIYGWARAAMAGEEVSLKGDLQRDFTYVADTARGVVLAWQARRLSHRLYNISSGLNIAFSEALETLKRLRPKFRVRINQTTEMVDFFRESLRGPLDIGQARKDLGFVPEYDLERGLKSYLDWLERFPI
jgi:nucleoside-diphosphate-sugar epimerase